MARMNPVTLGLVLGLFLAALDTSVVAPAMPTVVRELGGKGLYALPFMVYLLFFTITGPLWGRASDLYGRRRLYLASVALFLLGSSLSGMATSMGWLILGRIIQGIGGGGVQTLTFTLAGEMYPMGERAKVQGFFSGVWGISGLLGPTLGGLLVHYVSWRWVFYLNLPFGFLAAYLVGRSYRDAPAHPVRLPLLSSLFFALASGLLVWGLEARSGLALAGLLLLPLAFAYQSRAEAPLLPLALFQERLSRVAFWGNLLAGAAYYGAVAYVPLFADARGVGPLAQGLLLTPMTVGWTTASIVASRLLVPLGVTRLAQGGFLLLTLGFLGYAFAGNLPLEVAGVFGLVAGVGMGFSMLTLLVSAQGGVRREELGALTAAIMFARFLGGAVGVALMGGVVNPGGHTSGPALVKALEVAFLLAAGLALLAFLVAWPLRGLPPLKAGEAKGSGEGGPG